MNSIELLLAMPVGQKFTLQGYNFVKGYGDFFTTDQFMFSNRSGDYFRLDGKYICGNLENGEAGKYIDGFIPKGYEAKRLEGFSKPCNSDGYYWVDDQWERMPRDWTTIWKDQTMDGYYLQKVEPNLVLTGPIIEIDGYKLHINDVCKSLEALKDYEVISISKNTVTLRKV